jgi:hypothetical protein
MVSCIIIPKELIVVIGSLWVLASIIICYKYPHLMDVDATYGNVPASVWIIFTLVIFTLVMGVAVGTLGFIFLFIEIVKLMPCIIVM